MVGLVRKNNQDSGYASPQLLVVADGMGGAAAGDLASAVAIDVIKQLDTPELLTPDPVPAVTPEERAEPETVDQVEQTIIVPIGEETAEQPAIPVPGPVGRNPLLGRLETALAEANERIADQVAADYTLEGMGTTVTGAIFDGSQLALAHIGDSRAYLLHDGFLDQLSHDHSWVQSLVDDGKITPAEAAYHPHRSLLLKVLNGQPANDPDLTTVPLQAGDRLLFCSDGLSGMVDDDEIAALMAIPDLDQAVSELVDAALAGGGIDNITVILAEAVAGPAPAEETAAGTAVTLGAAAERDIPAAPRRTHFGAGLLGLDDADDDELYPDHSTAVLAATVPGAEPTADDESRYAPRAPAKRRGLRTLLVGLAVLLVTAAGLGAGYAWTRTQYFVGADNAQVAIFQGLPDGIPGLPLSEVYEIQDLPVASLPGYYQAQVIAGIEVADLDAARATVDQLKREAARCSRPPLTPTPSPTPTGSPKSVSPSPTRTIIGPKVPTTSATSPSPTGTAAGPATPQGC
ncbi:MAG: protein phosphatase 2C domain-containing protein [Microlunatus sp.]